MKKATILGLTILLLGTLAACAPKAGDKSGAAAGEALIKLMPKGTTGVIAIDLQRAMGTEAAQKALQQPEAKAKYDEFVAMSGIDPMKDISYVAVGLKGMTADELQEVGVVINMSYDRDKLLGLIKEKAPDVVEEAYNGVTVYSNLDGVEGKQTTRAAFLDDSHIVMGSESGVKGIIDVHQKKAESLAKDEEMSAILGKADKSAIVWGVFEVPQELVKKALESSPQLKVLEAVNALVLAFDYKMSGFVADIRTLGGTKEQNDNLASALNGFKSLGAMFAAQEPVVGDLLNGIVISSGEDYTRLSLSLSQETLEKLAQLAQSQAGELMKPKKEEPVEEKK